MLSPADRAVVEGDHALPGLATVLDADASTRLVTALVPDAPAGVPTISYIRYKPGASCLTALRYPSRRGDAFITLKAVSLDATEKWNKYADHRGALRDEATRVVVRQFPADGALKGPRWLFDPTRRHEVSDALGLASTTFDVIAYKPERRLVVAALDGARPVSVIKCYDADAYVHALRAHRALAGASGLRVQSASAWSDRRCTIATPWIHGRVLNVATDDVELFADAGDALAAVHNSALDVRRAESETATQVGLHSIAAAVARWSPSSSEALQRILERLEQMRDEAPVALVPIHGDFYTKQLLVGPDGVSLLDFDECAIADPHIDLALFAAHLERDVLRGTYTAQRANAVTAALLSGYCRSRPFNARQQAWRTAEALLRLAPHPFRHRDPEWPALTARLIARAESMLDAMPRAERPHAGIETLGACETWQAISADPALQFATALRDPATATRLLTDRRESPIAESITVRRTTVMRHKTGRRCLVSLDVCVDGATEEWLGKVRARGTDLGAALIHQQLWGAGARCIAEPMGTVHALRMTMQRAVPGISLLQAIAHGESPHALGATIACTLHTLHRVPVTPARQWSLDDELRVLANRALALQRQRPIDAPHLTRLYQRLTETAAPLRARSVRAVVHRDFYHDQVLMHGGECTIVDLDLVASGDPALDAGNFVAHLIELHWRERLDQTSMLACVESFTAESVQLAPGALSHDAITRYTLLALGRLIEIAVRHPDRVSYVPVLIERLTSVLADCGQTPELTALTGGRTWNVA